MKPDLVIVDLETSGLDERFHEILEVAAIRVDATTFEERARFVAKVKPLLPVDPEAAAVNGYAPELWRDAISLDEALRGMFPVIEGARWVGSKPSFDFDFVSTNAQACGRKMPKLATHRLVDVSGMAEPLVAAGLIAKAGLEALREYFGIHTGAPHRALNDALATVAAYRLLLALYQPAIELRRAA
jgi:DNA polymerase III epsilon subunit-like protein